MLKVILELELVESLVEETSVYTGTVLLCELRDTMQQFLGNGLIRGCQVSIREAFDYAWSELITVDSVDGSDGEEEREDWMKE